MGYRTFLVYMEKNGEFARMYLEASSISEARRIVLQKYRPDEILLLEEVFPNED